MNSEKFCLRWNDFENNISEAFKELRELNDFFDVTLVCGDEQLQAHKLILSACSPFFGNILRRNPHHHPLLYLKGVRYTDLQSVLNFMYHGEVSVAQEELNSFLAVAEDLRVKGLTQNNQNNENLPKKSSISEPKIVNKDKPTIKLCNKEMKAKASLVKSSFESSCSYIDKEEVQQVSLIKTEPTDFPPPNPPMHLQHSSYGQQASYSITTEEENTAVYTDESYGEYEQYGEEQGYPMAENGNADAGTNKNEYYSFELKFDVNYVLTSIQFRPTK